MKRIYEPHDPMLCIVNAVWLLIPSPTEVSLFLFCFPFLLCLHQSIIFLSGPLHVKFHALIWHSQVPVANGSASYPFSVDVPRNTRFLFSNKTVTPAKAIAKSIVRSIIMFDGIHELTHISVSLIVVLYF